MRILGRRVVFYLITALAAITVDFFIPRMMPGNPAEAILAHLQGQISASTVKSLAVQFGVQTKEGLLAAEVTLRVPARLFAVFDEEAGQWSWPQGVFTVQVGRSSRDLRLSLTVRSG